MGSHSELQSGERNSKMFVTPHKSQPEFNNKQLPLTSDKIVITVSHFCAKYHAIIACLHSHTTTTNVYT